MLPFASMDDTVIRRPRTNPPRRRGAATSMLAALSHPGIVGYVAHGVAEDGRPFRAMEWLEGEDLSARLARQPLSPGESLAVLLATVQGHWEVRRHG